MQHFSDNLLPLSIQSGKIVELLLPNSSGITELSIVDNGDVLAFAPSLFGSVDNGITYERLSAAFMRKLAESSNDCILRIDCTQLAYGVTYIINDIVVGHEQVTDFEQTEIPQHFYYDASQRCFDEHDLKKVVNDNILELSAAAQDNAAWPIKYFKSEQLSNIDVLNAYSLRAINDVKEVAVFFPHRKTIGQLDFDQFGLQYEELTTIHILADEFRRVYADEFARPTKTDIIYIEFLDQFFEISDVSDVKTPTNLISYFDCTLRFLTDRQAVAKDDDILNLSGLVDGNDREADLELKEPTKSIQTFAKHTWSLQTFEFAQLRIVTERDNALYGIAYVDGWKRIFVNDGHMYVLSLDGNSEDSIELVEPVELYFAKLARFDSILTEFNANMYYTTNSIPRLLRPLELIELQKPI